MTTKTKPVMEVVVTLNGTDKNPYHKLGLKCNPFPQIAKAEYAHVDNLLADLAARPIENTADLRLRLAGCSEEFILLCLSYYKPGRMVRFAITFPE